MSSPASPARVPVEPDLPAVPDHVRRDIAERIAEFEDAHEADVLADGPGWVPRIRRSDYFFAGALNVVLIVWLVVAFL